MVRILKELIHDSRTKLGLTEKAVADAVNTTEQVVKSWEEGTSVVSLEVMHDLADTLKISEASIMASCLRMSRPENPKINGKEIEFPEFLFADCPAFDHLSERLRQLNLSTAEQELLGLELVYSTNTGFSLSSLPYNYISKFNPNGGFKVINTYSSLTEKLRLPARLSPMKNDNALKDYVIGRIADKPDKPFRFDLLPAEEQLLALRTAYVKYDSLAYIVKDCKLSIGERPEYNFIKAAAPQLYSLKSMGWKKTIGVVSELNSGNVVPSGIPGPKDPICASSITTDGCGVYSSIPGAAYANFGSSLIMGYVTYGTEGPEDSQKVYVSVTEKGKFFLFWYEEHFPKAFENQSLRNIMINI